MAIPGPTTIAGTARDIHNTTVVLQHIDNRQSVEPNKIHFNIRHPENVFIGRSLELDKLCNFMELTQNSSSATNSHTIVIFGLGGIGKTQLARKFIKNNQVLYHNVIWIDSESMESINESFKKLAEDKLDMPIRHKDGREKDVTLIIENVFTRLCTKRTLFIYDNVDKVENISLVLTMGVGERDIIITSRIQEWGYDIEFIHLGVWSIQEAIEYVTKSLKNSKDSDDDKKLLVEKLQYFPLALKQATAHIIYQQRDRSFQITNYIDKYATKEMLDSQFFTKNPMNIYERTTFKTWQITIDAIEQDGIGRLAVRVLRIMAYFDSTRINRDIFFNLTINENNEENKESIRSAVRILVNYSMIDGRQRQEVLSIHRLVQKVIKLNLENPEPILRDGLILSSKIIECTTTHENHRHAISVFSSSLKLNLNSLVEEFGTLPSEILKSLNKLGKYNRAKDFGDKIIVSLKKILGENHQNFLLYESSMAQSFLVQRRFPESLKAYEELLVKQKRILGEYHQETLKCKSDIAYSLGQLDRRTEALQVYQDIFEKQKNILGEDDPRTLVTRYCIATSLNELENYSESLQVYQEVFEKQKKILGENNARTLITKIYIGSLYNKLKNHSKALEVYQDVWERRQNVLEEGHPDILISKFYVAYTHRELGKQMYEEVSDQVMKIFLEDTDSVISKLNMANINSSYSEHGTHEEMLKILQDVFEKERYM